ncbi:MAG: AMP-binding protein, partial [Candidatus Omnitrophica bacterium]|nr:AMP-binding protein [Candidatus Omnitrophota bacterium]
MGKDKFNIYKRFVQKAKAYPQKPALLYKKNDEYLSVLYRDVRSNAVSLGNYLKENGVKKGDRVVIIMENRPEFVWSFLSAMYLGAVAVPLDVQYPPAQIKKLISHCGAKIVITQDSLYKLAEKAGAKFCIVADNKSFTRKLSAYKDEIEDAAGVLDEDDLAALFYTSGTTGVPKAVMLTHKNLLSNVEAIGQLGIADEKDIVLSVLPLHHTYAFTSTLLLPLYLGGSISYPKSLLSLDILDCMKKTNTTIFIGVPQIFSLMHATIKEKIQSRSGFEKAVLRGVGGAFSFLRDTLKVNALKGLYSALHKRFGNSLRFMVSGGARLDPVVAKDFCSWGFCLLEGYGLTETSPVVTLSTPGHMRFGSVGRPLPGVEIKICDAKEDGIGEVVVRGPNLMTGYYKLKDETEKVIRDGWFYTGDRGFIDSEGILKLSGRKSEGIVLSNGENIDPEEIESWYSKSPYVKEIAVFANASGMAVGSTYLAAVVVIDEDYFRRKKETNVRKKLKWEFENISAELPTYKRLKGFEISKEPLARTRLGKIIRYKLADLYKVLKSQVKAVDIENVDPVCLSTVSKGALKILSQMVGREVGPKDHLEIDLGLDSLGRMEVFMTIQTNLKIELNEDQAMEFFMSSTVGELLEKLDKYRTPDSDISGDIEEEVSWSEILRVDPPEALLKKINVQSVGIIVRVFSFLLFLLLKIIFKVFFLMSVEGKENIKEGPYL